MSETMHNLKVGTIDPLSLQAYLEGRKEEFRPVFVYKHRRHDIINIAQDKDEQWFMLTVNENRMSRMFRINSNFHYDGECLYMNDSKG